MSDDELTPQRLDAIMDGEQAVTDAERDMLMLAAELRSAAPRPSDALQARIAAIGDRPAHRAPGRRRLRALAGAPVFGALVVALIAGGVVVRSLDTGRPNDSAGADATTLEKALTTQTDAEQPFKAAPSSDTGGSQPQPGDQRALPNSQELASVAGASMWSVPAAALEPALADLRAIARDNTLTLTATSAGQVTQVQLEIPATGRARLIAAISDAIGSRGGVSTSGPIALDRDQTVLTITLTPAR